MNKPRRKALAELLAKLQDLKSDLETLHSEEDEAFNNMPEALQQSERGQASETAKDALDEANTYLGDAISSLEGIE